MPAKDWRELIHRKPWLLPFLYALTEAGGKARVRELAEALEVKSRVAKAAMRLLKRYFLTEEGLVRSDVAAWLAKQDIRVRGRRMTWKAGSCYVLIKVKRSRISTYTVPAELLEKVREELKKRKVAHVRELASRLNSSPISISRALQVLELLGKVKRCNGKYCYT